MLPISVYRLIYRSAPASIRARLKNRVPPGLGRFPLTLPDGQTLIFDHPECSKILRRFAWKGIEGHEPQTIRLFQACAKNAVGVLDIGAYFGLYALIAAKSNRDAMVHAFEPVPENVRLMQHFIELNQAGRVFVHSVALAESRGDAVFFIPEQRRSALPPTGSLKNRFLPGEVFYNRPLQTLEVPTATLDELIEDAGIARIDLVKIDTEETEHEVLASGAMALRQHRPDIVMEVIFKNPHADEALDLLCELGYRCFQIGPSGLTSFVRNMSTGTDRHDGCEIFCTCRPDAVVSQYSRYLRAG